MFQLTFCGQCVKATFSLIFRDEEKESHTVNSILLFFCNNTFIYTDWKIIIFLLNTMSREFDDVSSEYQQSVICYLYLTF